MNLPEVRGWIEVTHSLLCFMGSCYAYTQDGCARLECVFSVMFNMADIRSYFSAGSSMITSMLFADCEHLENSIKRSWMEQALQNEHFFV